MDIFPSCLLTIAGSLCRSLILYNISHRLVNNLTKFYKLGGFVCFNIIIKKSVNICVLYDLMERGIVDKERELIRGENESRKGGGQAVRKALLKV